MKQVISAEVGQSSIKLISIVEAAALTNNHTLHRGSKLVVGEGKTQLEPRRVRGTARLEPNCINSNSAQ